MKEILVLSLLVLSTLTLTSCKKEDAKMVENDIFTNTASYLDIEMIEVSNTYNLSFDDFINFNNSLIEKVNEEYPGLFEYTIDFPFRGESVTKENIVRDAVEGDNTYGLAPVEFFRQILSNVSLIYFYDNCEEADMVEGFCNYMDNKYVKVVGTNDKFMIYQKYMFGGITSNENTTYLDFTDGVHYVNLEQLGAGREVVKSFKDGVFVFIDYIDNIEYYAFYLGDVQTNEYLKVTVGNDELYTANEIAYYNKATGRSLLYNEQEMFTTIYVGISEPLETVQQIYHRESSSSEIGNATIMDLNLFYYDGWTNIQIHSPNSFTLMNDENVFDSSIVNGSFSGFDTYFASYSLTDEQLTNRVDPIEDGLSTTYDIEELYDFFEEVKNSEDLLIYNDVNYRELGTIIDDWFTQYHLND